MPSLFARPLIGLITLYRYTLSSLLGRHCRYLPTCSEYGREAIETHGALKGGWLAIKRIGRCRPGCAHGYDPVPPREHSKPH